VQLQQELPRIDSKNVVEPNLVLMQQTMNIGMLA
jgi:hypothetical protein